MTKATLGRYAAMGGAIFCGYHFVKDYMRHHEEADPRPHFVDHVVATTLTTTAVSAFYAKRPWWVFTTAVFSVVLIAPITFWFEKRTQFAAGTSPANIFYTNDTTDEEIERFRHQDMIEQAAFQMSTEAGYGYIKRGDQAGY